MKQFSFILSCLLVFHFAFAQDERLDSLKRELAAPRHDTTKVIIMELAARRSAVNVPDTAIYYGEKALELGQILQYNKVDGKIYRDLGTAHRAKANFSKALELFFQALAISEKTGDLRLKGQCENSIGIVYSQLNDNLKVIEYQKRAIKTFKSINERNLMTQSEVNLGRAFRRNNQLDSAGLYYQIAYQKLDEFRNSPLHSWLFMEMGRLHIQIGNLDKGIEYLRTSVQINNNLNHYFYNSFAYNAISQFYRKLSRPDSCIFYAKKALESSQKIGEKFNRLEALNLLAEQYESFDIELAYHYMKLAREINNQLYSSDKLLDIQRILAEEQQRQRKIVEENAAYRNRIKQYSFIAGVVFLMCIVLLLYSNNRRKQKANLLLVQQKSEIESTLDKLKSTQSQLIQSEKMASLGELTAGIAHEIQNPLNFVNNFSEVNSELIEELEAERIKLKVERDENLEKEILNDIKENEEKIRHHGQRASVIVKGMLDHSRLSDGKKELTDINALADEYLRLAYHGLRAKDKSFNADYKTELDKSLPKVNVIPQDIGRVLLNLINNAFYASNSKSIATEDSSFKPMVEVATKMTGDKIQITVKDNGPGIPEEIKEKIFQPFFTTKPTGSGTGLGLSLSYDIVKAHAGDIKVESPPAGEAGKEGAGTEFIIKLPKT